MSLIIVSNKVRIDRLVAVRRRRVLSFLGIVLVLLLVAFILMPELGLMGIPLLLFSSLTILSLLRFKPYFHCFTEGDRLHLWFRVQRDNNGRFRRSIPGSVDERLAVYLNTVYGYESHSFFTKEQQLICLLLRTGEGIVRTQPIPVEHLDAAEQQQFYAYLDQLISDNKRRLPLPEHIRIGNREQGKIS